MSKVTARRAIVLVLLAASLLLAVPGGAAAHVKAKYRGEYKAKLIYWKISFDTYDNAYASTREQSNALAATMATEIGVPDKRAQLLAHEQFALAKYNNTKSLPATWRATIYPALKADLRKASRWFASSRDRASYRAQTLRVRDGFTSVTSANDEAIWSFKWLGQDPPDLVLQEEKISR